MMKMKVYRVRKKKKFKTDRNPYAETLREQKFRQRVVHPKHVYDRKKIEQIEIDEVEPVRDPNG